MEVSMGKIEEFEERREQLNQLVLSQAPLIIKRFFSLDTQTYQEGHLSGKIKELLGLVASLVLRCDDCITYHIIQCVKAGWKDEEIMEALGVGLVVGGSIVIPHLRRAVEILAEARDG